MSETIAVLGLAGRIGLLGRLRLSRRRPWRIALIGGGLAAMAGLLWMAVPRSPAPPLVAVLAFEAEGEGADTSAAARGLADEIIISLAANQGLRVAARGSSFAFQGGDKRDAARCLGARFARFVLDGSARLDASPLRVSAQLSERGHAVVWADEFVAPLGEAAGLKLVIARELAARVVNGQASAHTAVAGGAHSAHQHGP